MGSRLAKRHAVAANQLGLRAARRMALQSATVSPDQVEESYYRETEFLGLAVGLVAEDLDLACDRTRGRFLPDWCSPDRRVSTSLRRSNGPLRPGE